MAQGQHDATKTHKEQHDRTEDEKTGDSKNLTEHDDMEWMDANSKKGEKMEGKAQQETPKKETNIMIRDVQWKRKKPTIAKHISVNHVTMKTNLRQRGSLTT